MIATNGWFQGVSRIRQQHQQQRRWNATEATAVSASATAAKQSGPPLPPPVPPRPTMEQLRILALRSAIPMVGFGIMDNLVMITAGEAIDSTIGVSLGISTMAAAGFGQCCSDVAGVTSGGIVDSAVSKLNLRHHGLTEAQLDTRISRTAKTFGACVGVLTGCLLGMSCLLL